jgi:hypothetical protein
MRDIELYFQNLIGATLLPHKQDNQILTLSVTMDNQTTKLQSIFTAFFICNLGPPGRQGLKYVDRLSIVDVACCSSRFGSMKGSITGVSHHEE